MRLKGNFKQVGVAMIILIISIVTLLVANKGIAQPFQINYKLNSPSGVFLGENNWKYVVDGAKKMVLAIDGENHLEHIIHGEQDTEGFYYASLICSDEDNNIYVADTLYADKGTIILAERIIKFDSKGRFLGTIGVINYTDEELAPLQYGNILSLDFENGSLIYTYKTEKGLAVYKVDADGVLKSGKDVDLTPGTWETKKYRKKISEYVLEDVAISSADLDLETLLPVFITRTGEVYKVDEDSEVKKISKGNRSEVAWNIESDAGSIYITNLASKEIVKISNEGSKEVIYQDEISIIYQLSVKNDVILATDYGGLYLIKGDQVEYITTLKSGDLIIDILLMFSFMVALLSLAYLVINTGFAMKGIWKNESFQKAMIIVSVAMFISTLVVYIALSAMFQLVDKNIMKDINLFCEIMVQETDVEALEKINDISDYRGESYLKIKGELDQLIEASYANGTYYYYIIYKHDQNIINGVMDYEDTMTTYHPFYEWGDNSYTDVLEQKSSIEFSNDVSSYGTWSFVLKPILNDAGDAVGIMEIGVNTDEIVKSQNNLIKDIVVAIIGSVIVMIILMIEVVFYMHYRERKRESCEEKECGYRFPVRSLIFVSFLADSMQDAFIPILVSKRYQQIMNIPKEIGIAFPITMQLFTTALFAFLGGGIVTRMGIKKTLIQGFLIQMIGYIICAITTDYMGILIGKSIVGIGMGLIIVVVNTIAAVSGSHKSGLFGEINAGILAGVTAGVGIGAVIISIQSYSTVYSVAAAIILFGFVLALLGDDYLPSRDKAVKTSTSMVRFIFNREIITFLLLILTPFLIALSYREYFFPLYAETMGMTESTIGYIYLISGLIVIYIGPSLTKNMIEKLGERKTVITSSIFMCVAAFVFVAFSSILAAVAGIFILSIAISFGYASQSTYYSSRPLVSSYGEGRAMGVYALFDNGGQTLGPIIYGSALAFGFRTGVMVVGVVLAILIVLFIISNLRRGENDASVFEH